MICIFIEDGMFVLVIVIEIEFNCIMQVKVFEIDGYLVVQVIIGLCKVLCVVKLVVGYFVKVEIEVGWGLWEFMFIEVDLDFYKVGDVIQVDLFEVGSKVDVIGIFKGKGFVGIIK